MKPEQGVFPASCIIDGLLGSDQLWETPEAPIESGSSYIFTALILPFITSHSFNKLTSVASTF